jgi:type IV secretion system protein VirD4
VPEDALSYVRERMAASRSAVYLGAGAAGWVTPGPERSALVLGPPRAGKTASVVVPTVLAAPASLVSASTKPDVAETTSLARRRLGQCWLYDPGGDRKPPEGVTPLRWSPVESARAWDEAVLVTHSMVRAGRPHSEESHWTERAEALLAPLLHASALDGACIGAVVRWVNRRELSPALRSLERHSADQAADLLAGIASTDERELSGILSTASGVLSAYRSGSSLESASHANFDPRRFVLSGDTVYICAPGLSQSAHASLVAGLVGSITHAAYGLNRAWPPLVLALDELANIAPLPSLPATAAEGGSQGVVTLACLQDLSQARERWGQLAEGFLSLFSSCLLLPGVADVRTLQAISALAGDEDALVSSRTRAGWSPLRATVSTSTRSRPRLGVDAVARGRRGHALLLDSASGPAWCRLTPWYRCSPWREAARGE